MPISALLDGASPSAGFPLLAGLPWASDRSVAQTAAYELLKEQDNLQEGLATWLESMPKTELDVIIERSVERSSHYKWYLGGDRKSYLVWLHQYKSPEKFKMASTFAASVHNHRLEFSSRVICGALHVTWFQARLIEDRARLTVLDRRRLTRGTVVHMRPDEIHGIDAVEDNTFTLLVQGPAERHFSTVFRVSTGEIERQEDLDALYPSVIQALRI
jgi:hypothetical protein